MSRRRKKKDISRKGAEKKRRREEEKERRREREKERRREGEEKRGENIEQSSFFLCVSASLRELLLIVLPREPCRIATGFDIISRPHP
jgi:hypothetical protein